MYRLYYVWVAERAGKIQGKMAAEQAAAKHRGAPKRAQRSLGLGVDRVRPKGGILFRLVELFLDRGYII